MHSAETAAARLTTGVTGLDIPGLTASAGVATLATGLEASEVHRRANLCLTAARAVGAGQVIRYRESR